MMTQATEKKDVQKLQRTIVDALEDVKAQDLVVFDTEHLSSLFERVIIASGSSNRQTKALAASVRDKVRNAGFGKPRIEGEDNGEWIIVDCGPVVAHIMQPNIRQYYHLEEIWGEKPVRLKFGAPKPAAPKPKAVVEKKPAAKKTAAKKAPAKSAGAKSATKPAAKSTTKPAAKKAASSSKPVAKKAAPKKPKA
ncbi:MAG: ribosome silencing factor [Betaproteobacteria bacterium]|nr:ribosome silencing factor [Betaproteobacteria bacterium]